MCECVCPLSLSLSLSLSSPPSQPLLSSPSGGLPHPRLFARCVWFWSRWACVLPFLCLSRSMLSRPSSHLPSRPSHKSNKTNKTNKPALFARRVGYGLEGTDTNPSQVRPHIGISANLTRVVGTTKGYPTASPAALLFAAFRFPNSNSHVPFSWDFSSFIFLAFHTLDYTVPYPRFLPLTRPPTLTHHRIAVSRSPPSTAPGASVYPETMTAVYLPVSLT
ncbi:hypothetical protein LZ30DRAFT_473927 [Colletotrichum cereale]|nr:hypothetical protein LZ30DRAFT_473927 [Colletotrichum cereale]